MGAWWKSALVERAVLREGWRIRVAHTLEMAVLDVLVLCNLINAAAQCWRTGNAESSDCTNFMRARVW